jgi:lipopolysaccharide transport system permease protein
VTVIVPVHGWLPLRLGELWSYRELVYFLAWREVKIRYKQTALGACWAVLQPLAAMGIFSLVFGRLARLPSDGVPYPLFSLAALVPWTYFSTGIGQAANSLVGNQHLLRKVYFPRLALPLAAVLAAGVDFLIAFALLLIACLAYGVTPGPRALWLLPVTALALAAALGVGLWLAAYNVRYRDVRYALPFLTQLWLYATPVVYPSSLLPSEWRTFAALNPLVGVVEGFRWALLGTASRPGPLLAVSALSALALLASGVAYFRRVERHFADIV